MHKRIALFLVLAALSASAAFAQNANVVATDPSTKTRTEVGDATNHALRVTCVDGCEAGGSNPTDTDDGSIAANQTALIGAALSYVWNGSNWARWTGQVTIASSQTIGISGTLPAFASTPAFTISGTLPAFASTPTFNIAAGQTVGLTGTVPLPTGASTLAEQQTQTTALQTIDDLRLAQGSTTSGQAGVLTQGAVSTSAPSYTNGQTSPFSLNTSGELRVALSGGGSNAAASATGSAVPAAAGYTGVNVGGTLRGLSGMSLGSVFAGTVVVVDGSGNPVTTFGGSGGTASNVASAVPSQGTYAGFSDGTNMQGARVFDTDSGAGAQYVAGVSLRKTASGGSVEAGTSSDPLRIDPTGTTTQPVSGTVTANIGTSGSLALDASVTGLQVSQGSTTSGQKGGLTLGAVTTGAPSYTTAQSSPISLTTAGALRTDSSATTQPVSGTVTANAGTGTFTVSASSLPLPSGAATSANQSTVITSLQTIDDLVLAQGATTSGKSGVLTQGAVSTSAPSYTNGQTSPVSLTTGGAVRVEVMNGGSGGTAAADDADFTAGTTSGTPVQGVYETSPSSVTAGDMGIVGITETRAMRVALEAADGTPLTPSTDATAGSAASTTGPQLMISDGTNAVAVRGDATNGITVNLGSNNDVTVASLPLPSGAATSANQSTEITSLQSIDDLVLTQGTTTSGKSGVLIQGAVSTSAPSYTNAQTSPLSLTTAGAVRTDASATTQPVSGTVTANAGSGTFAVSASSLPLPSGASTAAKQPALGTAGSASSDVISVQGIASMTPLLVNGSGVTQPVSGTITANAGTGSFTVAQSTASNLKVEPAGNVASGATDSGNPLKVGGKYNSSPITLTNGQRGDLQLDTNGNLLVNIATGGGSGLNAAASTVGSSVPADASYTGVNVGGTLRGAVGFDADSGGGSEYLPGVSLRKTASGGSVELGTSSDPIRTDPTGTTTQPVSGTVSANASQTGTWTVQPGNTANTTAWLVTGTGGTFPATQSGTWNVTNISGTVSLPTGASTAAKQPALGTAGTASSDVLTVQGIASMTALKVDGSAVTQPVSASALPLPSGAATAAKQPALGTAGSAASDVITVQGVASMTPLLATLSGTNTIATVTAVTAITNALPAGTNAIGKLAANSGVDIGDVDVTSLPALPAGSNTIGNVNPGTAANWGVGATGSAPPASANYISGLVGGATGGLTAGVPVCDQQAFLNMSTATTTELVALTSSRIVHICHIRAIAGGTTTMTLKRGTGTNCGTGTAAIDADYPLTAQTGYVAGTGFGEILDGRTAGNAICVTSSAAVSLGVFVRYGVY